MRSSFDQESAHTLTGAGGSGKTRLGLQVAAEMLDGSGDGVRLIELALLTDEEAVPQAIADVLGILPHPGKPALGVVLEALLPQRVLILLDNCEHLIGGCAKTADAILRRCPQVNSSPPAGPLGMAEASVPHMFGVEQGSWLRRMDLDQANFRRAIEYAATD